MFEKVYNVYMGIPKPVRYDLTNINWNIDEEIKDMKQFQDNMPDLILVRKVAFHLYPKNTNHKRIPSIEHFQH